MCFTSQPLSMNSTASQSTSSGWVGHSPCEPRSCSVRREPLAERELPQPVHEDASGQGVVLRGQPAGEIEARRAPAARVGLGQEVRNRGLHDLARLVLPVAAGEDAHHVGLLRRRDERLGDVPEDVGLPKLGSSERRAGGGTLGGDPQIEVVQRVALFLRPLGAVHLGGVQDLLGDLGAGLGAHRQRIRGRRHAEASQSAAVACVLVDHDGQRRLVAPGRAARSSRRRGDGCRRRRPRAPSRPCPCDRRSPRRRQEPSSPAPASTRSRCGGRRPVRPRPGPRSRRRRSPRRARGRGRPSAAPRRSRPRAGRP